MSIVEDVKEIGLLFDGQAIAFFVNFIVDSFKNTIQALMWPAFIAQWSPPYGAIGLGLMFMLFPPLLKKPIESWLFSGDDEQATPDPDSQEKPK